VLDLDGVVWLAGRPIPGAAEAVATLMDRGDDVVFVTNNSHPTVAEQEARLAAAGIAATGAVLTSAMAAATLVEPGEHVLLCAGPGAREAVEGRGATVVGDARSADVVVVGFLGSFDYDAMRVAADAVRAGARLLATNDDATYPTPDGPIPGAGSILAGIEKASGATATVAGKPHQPMVDVVRARIGTTAGVVVGDRADTDGLFARALGLRFALVLSGVTGAADLPVEPVPDLVAADLAEAVRLDTV
jgi:4-nitrophenyl phosphatase